jgi:signal transduction histidine kinase/CheY-like chemotaxis protein
MFDETAQILAAQQALNYQENLSFLSKSALNFLTLPSDDDIFIFVGKILSKFASKSIVIVFSYDQVTNISNIRYISGIYSRINDLVEILGKTPEEFDIKIPVKFRNKYLSDKTLKKFNGSLSSIVENNSGMAKEKARQIQKLLKVGNMYSMGMVRDGTLYGGLIIATKTRTGTVNSQTIETFIYQAGIALHRKHIDNELVKAKLIAEESDRLKSAFLSNMSHEIRTPLNGIIGLAQVMLKSEELAPAFQSNVQLIIDSGNTLLTLLEDIMDISKIEANQLKINKRPFVLNNLIDQLYSIFSVHPILQRKNANQKNIELKYDKPCEDITVMSDPDRLKQIFVNLIGNALKFTQSGYIHFGCLIENDEITFYVKDSGIGIPRSQTEKIFEQFIQVDNTLSRKFSGSGLGLAISHGLVSLLNGRIWCISDLGKGSNFFFTIPYQPVTMMNNTKMPQKTDSTSTVRDWSDYTALIVEDDVINFKVIEAMLRSTRVNIIHADDGLKAIEQARRNTHIDIVLMDIHIPEINGFEASSKILEFRPELPIIAQTANAMSEDREKCIEAGCVDYISKPIDMNELFAKMSKFLPDKEL